MSIAGEYENIPSWVADWPHCCDFAAESCDRLRWSAMVLKALKSQQNAPFHHIVWPGLIAGALECPIAVCSIAACGWALTSVEYLLHMQCCEVVKVQHLAVAEYNTCPFSADFITMLNYFIVVLIICYISTVEYNYAAHAVLQGY